MAALFTNNAQATLASGITNVATTLTVQAGQGAMFPSPTGADWAAVTLINGAGTIEIVKLTSRAGDTLTVVRGQEGTAAAAWLANDKVELRPTAAGLNNFASKDTAQTFTSDILVGGNLTINGNTTFGNAGADTVAFIANTMTVPAGGLTVSGGNTDFSALTIAGAAVMTATSVSTMTNKTLTTPIMSVMTVGGNAVSIPGGAADTLVARTSTDTLTNKTLSSLASASTLLDKVAGTAFRIGFKGVPQNPQNGNYTLVLEDASKYIYSKNTGAQTITIPTHAGVALLFGSDSDVITVINNGTTAMSIVPAGGVTLYQAGTANTGTRTLAAKGWATIIQPESDVWFINGAGLS